MHQAQRRGRLQRFRGGGSARDTLSMLDQLLAGAGPEGVTYRSAVALLGVTDAALLDEVVDALINVQGLLHPDLRGNLRGGLASTATGRALKDEWYARMKRMQA